MWRETAEIRAVRAKHNGRAVGRWGVLALGIGLALAGCGRPSGPIPHEVRKPIEPVQVEAPPQIRYTDIPKVPERLRRPSPPIEKRADGGAKGETGRGGHDGA